jgi:hypothetical protein
LLLVIDVHPCEPDEYILYAWDDGSGGSSSSSSSCSSSSSGGGVPFVINGPGGQWVAIAGKYVNGQTSGSGSGVGTGFQMQLGGRLPTSGLPLINIGSEISPIVATLVNFRARRGVPGVSGTTTIQLEVNGSPVAGATLSWTFADPAFTLMFVAISQAIVVGDRLSFRLTSAEVNGEDIFAEAD